MSEQPRNDRSRSKRESSDQERKAADRAKLSIWLIGVAFFSSLVCMFLAILLFVAF